MNKSKQFSSLSKTSQLVTVFPEMQTILHTESTSVLIRMFFHKLHTSVRTLMALCSGKILENTMYFLENLLGKIPLELLGVFCLPNRKTPVKYYIQLSSLRLFLRHYSYLFQRLQKARKH